MNQILADRRQMVAQALVVEEIMDQALDWRCPPEELARRKLGRLILGIAQCQAYADYPGLEPYVRDVIRRMPFGYRCELTFYGDLSPERDLERRIRGGAWRGSNLRGWPEDERREFLDGITQ